MFFKTFEFEFETRRLMWYCPYGGSDFAEVQSTTEKIKEKNQLQIALEENPFNENYDFSRIHLVFTNDSMGEDELKNWKIKTLEMKSLLLVLNVYICIFQEMQVPKD
ncbi:MAG: hypothetical protein ACFN08_01055 [Granulicatella sp.]